MFNRNSAAVAAVVALIAAGGAYAYWTQTGSGTDTAATGTTSSLTVNGTTAVTGLFPGDEQELAGNFDNPNDGVVRVTSVTVSIDSVTVGGIAVGGCTSDDYTINNPVANVGLAIPTGLVPVEIPTGDAQGAWDGPSIEMIDSASNQNACKGAIVHLAYASA
jgi:hypothetical protein